VGGIFHSWKTREKKYKTKLQWLGRRSGVYFFLLTDKFQKPEIQKDVLEYCVFPVLLYDDQTWSLKKKQKKMLQTCQRKWNAEYCMLCGVTE